MSTTPKEGDPPIVVQILCLQVHTLVNDRVWRVLENLHRDPKLHVGPAVTAVLATTMDLLARLNVYMGYPFRFARICCKWFPATYQRAITQFLAERSDALDAGFSLQLQEMALAQPSEMQERAFLTSDGVQAFLEEGAGLFAN